MELPVLCMDIMKVRIFIIWDRLDVDVSKKEALRKMNVMELRQEIALKIKIFVANSNLNKNF